MIKFMLLAYLAVVSFILGMVFASPMFFAVTVFAVAVIPVLLFFPSLGDSPLIGLGLLAAMLVPSASFAQSIDATSMFGLMRIVEGIPPWIAAITAVVTAANGITILTPTRSDDKIVNGALRVLNILAGNFGMNRNGDDFRR